MSLTMLLQIPYECALTSARALEGSPLLQRLNSDEELDDWTILAVFLAQNRHYTRSARQCDNKGELAKACGLTDEAARAWAPYTNALPSRTGAILEWTQAELDSVRTTSAAVIAAEVTKSTASAWQQVSPLLDRATAELGLGDGVVTEDKFRNGTCAALTVTRTPEPCSARKHATRHRGARHHGGMHDCAIRCRWGVCILLSRLIRLQDAPAVEALVPWADFINHSPASGAYVRASGGVSGQLNTLATGVTSLGDSVGGLFGRGSADPEVAVRTLLHMHADAALAVARAHRAHVRE
jgi:hypothetical protein